MAVRGWMWMAVATLLLAGSYARAQEEASGPAPPWGVDVDGEADHATIFHRRDTWEVDPECVPRIWVRPEYILAWIKSSPLPPLVTTGLTTDATPGALGLTYTNLLYGNAPLNYQDRHGFRIAVGGSVTDDGRLTVEASYLSLEGRDQQWFGTSPGSPIIARPFFNVLTNSEDSSLTTYPGLLSGSLLARSTSYLQSAEANATLELWKSDCLRLRGLAGFRYLGLRESLTVQEASFVTADGLPISGTTIFVTDQFRTINNFYGGQVGIAGDYRWRRFTVDMFAKAALGDVQQEVDINGATKLAGVTSLGGLLAQSSNIGIHEQSRFGVVPEAGLTVKTALGKYVVLNVGYSFLYFGKVVRPGPQVDLGVNPNLAPASTTYGAAGGPARPAFHLVESNFWAQMFNFGLTIQY